jgi:CheY-like chemotaxis protein
MGAKILTAEGHEVATVSNGQAAIHALEKAAPDLILADIFMPGRNGYEVCQFVKSDARLKGIPVLLIIGAMEPYDPEEGKKAGADGLITKPLESSDLAAMVQHLLHIAPPRPKPTRKKDAPVKVESSKPAEEPVWEDDPAEVITSSAPRGQKLVIPQEMSQQPIGMLADLLGQPEASVPKSTETDATAASPLEPMRPPEADESASPEDTESGKLLAASSFAPQHNVADTTVWTAEAAPITPEEEKLFEQPAANWGDLAKMVEQAEAPSSPLPPPLQMPAYAENEPALQADGHVDHAPVQPDALLELIPHSVAATATEPELESYEDLTVATVAHPEPIPPPQLEPVPVEEAEPLEEIEAAPDERTVPPLEQRVRQAVEDLMPEIIERVKQSLKE